MKNLSALLWICAGILLLSFTMCSGDKSENPDPDPGVTPEPPVTPQPTVISFLKASGTVLTNEAGDTIQLKGTNLGSYTSLEQWMSPVGHAPLSRNKWHITASSGEEENPVENLIDNQNNTWWEPDPARLSDQEWITLDFGEEEIFNSMVMNIRRLNNDASYNLEIYKFGNNRNWELVGSYKGQAGSDQIKIGMGDILITHSLRIKLNPQEYKNWKITELNLTMNDDYHIRKALIDRFGEQGADDLWDHYCTHWIQESDLDLIKSMGMNVVRLPFFWMEVMNENGTIKENGFRHLNWIINQCNKRDLFVILDLHCSPGGNDGYVTSGMAGYNNLWDNPEYKQMTLDIWTAVAERYKDNPTIACYDVLNESWSTSHETTLNTFYKQLYSAIRSVDNKHIVCFQAFPSFDFIDSPAQNNWENVMIQAHYYNTDYNNESSQSNFARNVVSEMIHYQQRWNVPVLAGEFSFWQHENVWKLFIAGMNSTQASWTNWSYKSREANASRANFAFYTDLSVNDPDLIADSAEEIKNVWSRVTSGNFSKNTPFINLVQGFINRTPQLAITPVCIKQWDGTFLKRSDEGALSFSAIHENDAAKFYIEKQANGGVALKSVNGTYVSVDKNSKILSCSKMTCEDSEIFRWVDLTNNEFALWGYDGFVSGNGGSTHLTSDRDRIDNWEHFSWIAISN